MALYNDHTVTDISRSDASAKNLNQTSHEIAEIIRNSREQACKTICFVTGVPGGKTLVGLNVATKHIDKNDDLYSVFLSGNGPLVKVLREALVRDKVRREKEREDASRSPSRGEVKMFIQNIHHFRDEYLVMKARQWIMWRCSMRRSGRGTWNRPPPLCGGRKHPGFDRSEPEFLISCLDRHSDWAVIVYLVGGGQEINTGEAGISGVDRIVEPIISDWHVHISPALPTANTRRARPCTCLLPALTCSPNESLHLSVSMRSFRAENVSLLVKRLLVDPRPEGG